MKVVYEYKRAMTLIGFSKRIRQSEGYVQCPAFWADYARRYKRLWQGAEPETAQENAPPDDPIGARPGPLRMERFVRMADRHGLKKEKMREHRWQ